MPVLHMLSEHSTQIYNIPKWLQHLNSCDMCICYGRIQLLSFNPLAAAHYFVPSYFENNTWIISVLTHSNQYPNSYILNNGFDLFGNPKNQYMSRFIIEDISKTNYFQLEHWDMFQKLEGWKKIEEIDGKTKIFDFTKVEVKNQKIKNEGLIDYVNFKEKFIESDYKFQEQLREIGIPNALKDRQYPGLTS